MMALKLQRGSESGTSARLPAHRAPRGGQRSSLSGEQPGQCAAARTHTHTHTHTYPHSSNNRTDTQTVRGKSPTGRAEAETAAQDLII